MGSLPDLTERTRAPPARAAARTASDPHRHRTLIHQIPVSAIYKKEWPWKKTKAPLKMQSVPASRRKDSASSSVGAASVRRLITRPPQRVPAPLVRRFTLLCVASWLCATALLPFTAYAGAEAGALPLAVMHTAAAAVAPFTPVILQKIGTRTTITLSNFSVGVLLAAHTVATPLPLLLLLYGACGATLSPMGLGLVASATTLAQAAGEERRRRVALRRALRALRAAHDAGLVVGSLLLGGALALWPEGAPVPHAAPTHTNLTGRRWPPDEYFVDDDYEERTCGAAGCPTAQPPPPLPLAGAALSAEGRRGAVALWAALAVAAALLALCGAAHTPAPPPPPLRHAARDPRALLAAPMGLFIGMQQGFIYTSYIKWYGVCVGGWSGAWRALCGAGALQAVAAGTLSMWAARGGGGCGRGGRRGALAAGGAAAHAALLLALLRWRAARTDLALPAVAAAAWGACAALWDVLQTGICVGGAGWRGPWAVVLCARHAGLALACAARATLCVRAQLAALAAALTAALAAHAALEVRLRHSHADPAPAPAPTPAARPRS